MTDGDVVRPWSLRNDHILRQNNATPGQGQTNDVVWVCIKSPSNCVCLFACFVNDHTQLYRRLYGTNGTPTTHLLTNDR